MIRLRDRPDVLITGSGPERCALDRFKGIKRWRRTCRPGTARDPWDNPKLPEFNKR